eukprot:scaffold159969_cov23-Tisochrysis_lutea.AAC.1
MHNGPHEGWWAGCAPYLLLVWKVTENVGMTVGREDGLGNEIMIRQARCTHTYIHTQVVDLVRGGLTALQRGTLGALVVMDVHARDVVAELAKEHVHDVGDFAWQAQLRSYWENT